MMRREGFELRPAAGHVTGQMGQTVEPVELIIDVPEDHQGPPRRSASARCDDQDGE
jgi:predicted membrane GTPase involved in stress response